MINVILDTDIGCDCDDAGAMAVLHILAARYGISIKAVTSSAPLIHSTSLIDLINRYYCKEILVGNLAESLSVKYQDIYAERIVKAFSDKFSLTESFANAVDVLREALSECEDNSVILIAIGPQTNLASLLNSKADRFSTFTGLELLERKLRKTLIMAGRFVDETPECNVLADITAAQIVSKFWPKEIIYSPHELGADIISGNCFHELQRKENPIVMAYSIHSGDMGRYSWDPVTVLYAFEPDNGFFTQSAKGQVVISDNGVTSINFNNKENRHTFLKLSSQKESVEEYINKLICM